MYQMKHLKHIVHLRLIGGAFAVYQQLKEKEKEDFSQIKFEPCTGFGSDGFLAYEQIAERHLCLENQLIFTWWSYKDCRFCLVE